MGDNFVLNKQGSREEKERKADDAIGEAIG